MRVGWITVLAACGRLDFDALGDGGGVPGDGKRVDAGSGSNGSGFTGSGCLSPGTGDNFMEILPCKQWGEPVVENAMLNVGSNLTITPDANAQSAGGCLNSALAFGEAGFFVRIGQFPNAGEIQLAITANTSDWAIASQNHSLFLFSDSGGATPTTIAYDATQAWWRLRPSGNTVVYETSADGEAWTLRYTSMIAAPTTVGGTIEDVVDDPAPDPAIIDGIDICP